MSTNSTSSSSSTILTNTNSEENNNLNTNLQSLSISDASNISSSTTASSSSPPTALDLCTRYSHDIYNKLPHERIVCSTCKAKSQWYCSFCLHSLLPPDITLPEINLPLHVHILRGKEENERKSTAAHIKILDNEHSSIYYLPDFPTFAQEQTKRILVLYPSPTSIPISSLNINDYDGLIVVDTTWGKVGGVLQCPEMIYTQYTYVHLSIYHTLFWRYQPLGPHCLSTIEALYYFFREWEINRKRKEIIDNQQNNNTSSIPSDTSSPNETILSDSQYYDGRYDNILLFFLHQYHRIQKEYTEGINKDREYCKLMRPGYIKGRKDTTTTNDNIPETEEKKTKEKSTEIDVTKLVPTTRPKTHLLKEPRRRVKSGWAVRADILSTDVAHLTIPRLKQLVQSNKSDPENPNTNTTTTDGEINPSINNDNSVSAEELAVQQRLFQSYVKRFEHQYASRSISKHASKDSTIEKNTNTATAQPQEQQQQKEEITE